MKTVLLVCLILFSFATAEKCEDLMFRKQEEFLKLDFVHQTDFIKDSITFLKNQNKLVPEDSIRQFLASILFTPMKPSEKCDLSEKLFKKRITELVVEPDFAHPIFRCMYSCFRSKLSNPTFMTLSQKCKFEENCWTKESPKENEECSKLCKPMISIRPRLQIREEPLEPPKDFRCVFQCLRNKITPQKFKEVFQKCKFDQTCWKETAVEEYNSCKQQCGEVKVEEPEMVTLRDSESPKESRCVFTCLKAKLTVEKFKEVLKKCKFDKECWKQSAVQEYKDCREQCAGEVQSVVQPIKNMFADLRCIVRCLRSKLTPEKFREVFQKCQFSPECWKQEVTKEYEDCQQTCAKHFKQNGHPHHRRHFGHKHFGHHGHHRRWRKKFHHMKRFFGKMIKNFFGSNKREVEPATEK